MMQKRTFPRALIVLLAIAICGEWGSIVRADLRIPYVPDAYTLHLWHLDEAGGDITFDAVANQPITLKNALPVFGGPPPPNDRLGAPSFPGLGLAKSGLDDAHALVGGVFPDLSQFRDTQTGAFTFEAVIQPLAMAVAHYDILSGDGYYDSSGDLEDRAWTWRLMPGRMEWSMIVGDTQNEFSAILPTSGPDAYVPDAWYHVAVTFTGNKPAPGNRAGILTFYWTPMDRSFTEAHKLAEFAATSGLDGPGPRAVKPVLGIGGNAVEHRGLIGTIDEVRISRVARKANEMAFWGLSSAGSFFNTGVGENGAPLGGGASDPHWILSQSSDPANLGPGAVVFKNAPPLANGGAPGTLAGTNGLSMWIGPAGNAGGASTISPAGEYIYRLPFLIDSADASTVILKGKLWTTGEIEEIRLNGKPIGSSAAPTNALASVSLRIEQGFVGGWNRLEFRQFLPSPGVAALRVEFESSALPRSNEAPRIVEEPPDEILRTGANLAEFSVTALGSPPLSYQWRSDGAALPSATNRVLRLATPSAGGQGTNFSVVVRNDFGSTTSRVATLKFVATNHPPVPVRLSFPAFEGQPAIVPLSKLLLSASDPDHDPITVLSAEPNSLNAAQLDQTNVKINGATLVYQPLGGFAADEVGYVISDGLNASRGVVQFQMLRGPIDQSIPLGGSTTLGLASLLPLTGYSFQWQLNGTNITGANGSSVAISNALVVNAGAYRAVVINPAGEAAFSPEAHLTVGIAGIDFGPPRSLSNCNFAALESAIQQGGNIILPCSGPIYFDHPILVRTNVALTAATNTVLSGSNACGLFTVDPGAHLSLKNVTLTEGYVSALANTNSQHDLNAGTNVYGAAIWNREGKLTLTNCIVSANSLRGGDGAPRVNIPNGPGKGGSAMGGAIMSSNGVVEIDLCVFRANRAQGGADGQPDAAPAGGGAGLGGAIYQSGGELVIRRSSFELNEAWPGPTHVARYTAPVTVKGGAIALENVRAAISDCRFLTNSAMMKATAEGGAVYAEQSALVIRNTEFLGNKAAAGIDNYEIVGKSTARGGAVCLKASSSEMDRCFYSDNSALGGIVATLPYREGTAHSYGGALFLSGTNSVSNCAFYMNRCQGAAGDISFSFFQLNQPGNGFGGAIYSTGALSLANSTFAVNTASAGPVINDPAGIAPRLQQPARSFGRGGAIANDGSALALHCTFAANLADAFGTNFTYSPSESGSIFNNGEMRLEKTILANSTSNNFGGPVIDAGENLSSDASPTFSAVSSRNNIDPLLGGLRYNRGPTPTMALQAGSPAIDAATPSPLYPTDQRGDRRPFGKASDIGAYEVTATPIENVLEALFDGSGLEVLLYGSPSKTYEILSSTDLVSWTPFSSNAIEPLGRLRLEIPFAPQTKARLFKARQIGP